MSLSFTSRTFSRPKSLNPAESTRRRICTALGRQALAQAPPPRHEKWLHDSGPVPEAPSLPVGNYYTMVNHIKVLQQYTELLSEAASGHGPHAAYLLGGAESCGQGFKWFIPLCSPLIDTGFKEYFQNLSKEWRWRNPGLFLDAEAAYRAYKEKKEIDLDCVRYIVSLLKPDSREYEVRVAKNILDASPSSFDEFQSEFLGWRKRGLYHALCLAAKSMPDVEDWVPPALVHEADELSDLLGEFRARGSCTKHRLAELLEGMEKRSDLFSNCLSGTLDKIAMLMRVPSDTGPETLVDREEETLDDLVQQLKFQSDAENPLKDSVRVWRALNRTFENSLPPSMLCPALDPPSRGTWGYPRLSLKINEDTGKLYIDHGPLQWMERSSYKSLKEIGVFYEPERLRDILFRMGDAVTSPELGQLLFTWKPLESFLKGKVLDVDELEAYKEWHSTRSNVFQEMSTIHPWMRDCTLGSRVLDVKKDILDLVPKPRSQEHSPPLRILAYRVDCPSRVILYQGQSADVDLDHTPPHAMKKASYPDRVYNRTISGIALLPETTRENELLETHDALRSLIAHEVAAKHDDFADHPFHRHTIKAQDSKYCQNVTCTTLAESVALFTGPKPSTTSHVGLNESTPWEGERIDHRYAEHQTGENGTRYRDWATMYHDGYEFHRSRLASHEVRVGQTYHTHFPVADSGSSLGPQKYSWVSVCSSLPADICVMRDLGGHSRLESLKRSVENRFMNDSKLLPVRFVGDTIERGNMELYTDEGSGQVMIAYAPSGKSGEKRKIEMISFRFG